MLSIQFANETTSTATTHSQPETPTLQANEIPVQVVMDDQQAQQSQYHSNTNNIHNGRRRTNQQKRRRHSAGIRRNNNQQQQQQQQHSANQLVLIEPARCQQRDAATGRCLPKSGGIGRRIGM